ncbi:MAG: hypothetical protein H0V89_00540 [Deltaproteobacteria bacterium]|nr:hypothetical protein [Deltaproteobacteria bacterium]
MKPLDEVLDALRGHAGTAVGEGPAGPVEVEVTDVDRLGIRVSRVRVTRGAVDIAEEAADLPKRLRSLSEPVHPVEIAPALGGARLRSVPRNARDGWYEVAVEPTETVVTRTSKRDGERVSEDWTMTRDQLDRLVRELARAADEP